MQEYLGTEMDNINKLAFGHLNIDSIWNKLELMSEQVKGNINVLMISETKANDSFPIGNFLIDRFSSLCRSNSDSKVEGIMLFVMEDIPSNLFVIENQQS